MTDEWLFENGREHTGEKGEMKIERIAEDISLIIFLRTVVGIVSWLQDELNDWDGKLVILNRMTGVNEERQGGTLNVVSISEVSMTEFLTGLRVMLSYNYTFTFIRWITLNLHT